MSESTRMGLSPISGTLRDKLISILDNVGSLQLGSCF